MWGWWVSTQCFHFQCGPEAHLASFRVGNRRYLEVKGRWSMVLTTLPLSHTKIKARVDPCHVSMPCKQDTITYVYSYAAEGGRMKGLGSL